MKDNGTTLLEGGAHAGPLQDTTASPDSNLAACETISAEFAVQLAPRRLRSRACKLDQDKGDTASAPLHDLGQMPAAVETTTGSAALLKDSTNKEHGTSDAGAIPEHIMQLCKSISDKQLVSKLRSKGKHHGSNLVTVINEAGLQMSLPGFPRTDTHVILSLVLPFLATSQQANETLPLKKGISKVFASGKTNARQHDAKKCDIVSSLVHTLASKRTSSTATVSSLLVQDTLVAKVHDSVSGKTVVLTPTCNLVVELDRLTPEEIASFTSRQHRSSVQNETAQEDGDRCFQVTREPKSVHDAHAPGPEQSQGQQSINLCSVQETDDSKGGASDTDVPALEKQPCQNYSSRSDHDEDSPSLLEPELCQTLQSSPCSSQASCKGTHSKRLGVRIGNPVRRDFADQATDEHLLSATTDLEESSQKQRCVPSPPCPVDPRMSEAESVHVQDPPQGTKRHIVRSVSPDVLRSPKRRRMRFTALQEEALVYGVMKYGRGSWKEINEDGWFNGRRTTELSDKYRNLEKYGHLPKVKRRVRDMLSAGVNPLKELRAVYDRQRLQRATSSTADTLPHGKQSPASQPKESGGALPARCPPDGDSTTTLSDDDASAEALQKQAEPRGPVLLKTVCSSPCGPSTSQAHPSAQSQYSSGSETDVLQEIVPSKFKEKRRRVPFTPLEEEALVAGVLKFGKGNWLRILMEGGFLGRTSTQLSDKYRNLKLYRQLDAIERTVKSKRDRGEDPLEELRRLSAAHWKR